MRQVLISDACPLAVLDHDLIDRLAGAMTVHRYAAGDTLIRQGDRGDTLFVVLDGQAEASVRPADGRSRVLGTLGRGSLAGEMGLLTKTPRTATVICRTPVRAALLSAADFDALAVEHPDLLMVLTSVLEHRLGQAAVDGLSGKEIRDYRIERCVGRGGMGIVYDARRRTDGERVALKMMNHRLVYRPQAVRRFREEAEVLRSLTHEAIAKVVDRFAAFKTEFLVMEFCEGVTLGQHLSEVGRLEEPVARGLVGQLADALRYLFAARRVHGDLKPSNVMVGATGRVTLLDFGLSRAFRLDTEVRDLTVSTSLSGGGDIAGTPAYMAPEQFALGHIADHRVDWYALACLALEALAGHPVFDAEDIMMLHEAKRRFRLPPRAELAFEVSPEMYDFLARGLEPRPEERGLDLDALARWAAPVEVSGPPVHSRPEPARVRCGQVASP